MHGALLACPHPAPGSLCLVLCGHTLFYSGAEWFPSGTCEIVFQTHHLEWSCLVRGKFIFCHCVFSCSVVSDSATPWTIACQASLSMGFPRQEYWSGLPFPSPWDHPNPGIEPESPALQANSLPAELPGEPRACIKAGPWFSMLVLPLLTVLLHGSYLLRQ